MKLVLITILFTTVAYGAFVFALYQEYLTTLPFCINDEKKQQCKPCPKNAKCIENEIQCDERYYLQEGQCLPVHVDMPDKTPEPKPHPNQTSSQKQKQYFIFGLGAFATFVYISFIVVQARNDKNAKQE